MHHLTEFVTPVVEHWKERKINDRSDDPLHNEQRLLPRSYIKRFRKEGNVLFNDALNTFYLRLYGIGHMAKVHSDSERVNPLPPHGLLFPINSKGSFICTIPQTG